MLDYTEKDQYPDYPLADLHTHLGSSIDPAVLWQIAHNLGITLPRKDYREFRDYITLSSERKMALEEYFEQIYHPILDKLSSGTHAVEAATYSTMSGAYRNGIELIELRTNPMKHNMNAEVDLDHLIMAMLHGMERALLEHKSLSAGIIFCIGREYDIERNTKIVDKAIKYRRRGVVGIDVAGPGNPDFQLGDYRELFEKARHAGLGITVHSGEVQNADDMWQALEYLSPDRIGHGIRAAYDEKLMEELARRGTVLEVCPLSNIATKAVSGLDEVKHILRQFIDRGVRFTINTDWPEIIEGGRLRNQYRILLEKQILTDDELRAAAKTGFDASFIHGSGIENYL